jgi:hypothetical protein
MSAHPPPVPPEQQSPHGAPGPEMDQGKQALRENERNRNLAEQGHQGNIEQNINNQGRQQDR